ncbi:MAG TPA: hypothetical protein VKL99_10140 [Candidatus Angelobacter sp.]|nr:hypothetical protein [Candidatus Angelobacter sp.]
MSKRLRLAGALIILGLVVQALSLMWNHPLSFIAFVSIGGLFLASGIVIYLLALVSSSAANSDDPALQSTIRILPH